MDTKTIIGIVVGGAIAAFVLFMSLNMGKGTASNMNKIEQKTGQTIDQLDLGGGGGQNP